jgi:hypothetical protein
VEQYCQQHSEYCDESMLIPKENINLEQENTTDLVLIDSVRPRDLQTWINHKLDTTSDSNSAQSNKLISWFPTSASDSNNNVELNDGHVNLYSKEFSQLASLYQSQDDLHRNSAPTISLFSPYNQTADSEDQCDSYLQIDVQVLRSTVIKGQLMSLQQYGSASTALLDGMKKDLIAHHHNVTRSNRKREHETIVKREKRAKKLSRVII